MTEKEKVLREALEEIRSYRYMDTSSFYAELADLALKECDKLPDPLCDTCSVRHENKCCMYFSDHEHCSRWRAKDDA